MNLIHDPWIPVERKSGATEYIAPHQISDPDVLRLAAPRPDFNGALLQFLIGLLQTVCPPGDHDQWVDWLDEETPEPDVLKEHFCKYAHAFELKGDGPRFMQDFSPLQGDEKPISALLIDVPGAQTLRENKDHFIKRDQIESLCPACAATALFTLQTNAPSGGAGHRTSLRGGGPLTTLVAPDPNGSGLPDDLWHFLWLNVIDQENWSRQWPPTHTNSEQKHIFPWLAPTRTSEKATGKETTPQDASPLQMYWGMPRRIHLQWKDGTQGHCDLCDRYVEQCVSNYITQNYGINYRDGVWQHPLSPHRIGKDGTVSPLHAQPSGISYTHWLGLSIGETSSKDEAKKPALTVGLYNAERKLSEEQLRLHAFGYDMDNMKARCWYQATFPLFHMKESQRESFHDAAQRMVTAAVETAKMTRSCVKEAWFRRPGDVKGDTAFLVKAFLDQTESDFFEQLRKLIEQLGGDGSDKCLREWRKETLLKTALQMFTHWAESGDLACGDPRRIVTARSKLRKWLYSPQKGLAGILGIKLDTNKEAA